MKINEIQLKYKPLKQPYTIKCSQDAYKLLMDNWDLDTIQMFEEFKIILMDRSNTVIGIRTISKGGTSGTVVDAKLIFSIALKALACSIILAHNHPSGQVNPSKADEKLTTKVSEGGKLIDVAVLDHLIVTSMQYYSFADEGLL